MKKFTAVLLLVVLVFSCVACGSEQKAEKYCWNCGEGITKEASFCEHCGAKIDTTQNGGAISNSEENANNERQQYIGIWKCEDENEYIYVYENGDGDYYGNGLKGGNYHYNHFNWEIEGQYFVKRNIGAHGGEVINKYELDGECLLNGQGKVVFRKYSNDPTIDI